MRIPLFFLCGLIAFSQNKKKNISSIYIPSKQELILDYPAYKGFIIDIWNKGKFNLIFSQVLKENDSINGTKILKEGSFNSFLIDKSEFIKIPVVLVSTILVFITMIVISNINEAITAQGISGVLASYVLGVTFSLIVTWLIPNFWNKLKLT